MSSQGRGSAVVAAAVAVVCLLSVLNFEVAQATNYTVGGAKGWAFRVKKWTKEKQFHAGDILVFNYRKGSHDVAVVNRTEYRSCKAPPGAKVYSSGNDCIKLVKGRHFFICSFPEHCQLGMRITVTAT